MMVDPKPALLKNTIGLLQGLPRWRATPARMIISPAPASQISSRAPPDDAKALALGPACEAYHLVPQE
jgi:hypothetical protein